MKVEENKEKSPLLTYAPVIGVAGLAALAIPLLPLLFGVSPDQA